MIKEILDLVPQTGAIVGGVPQDAHVIFTFGVGITGRDSGLRTQNFRAYDPLCQRLFIELFQWHREWRELSWSL